MKETWTGSEQLPRKSKRKLKPSKRSPVERQKLVFDASPLIHLAKAGLSSLVVGLEGEKYTTPAVFKEVVERGKEFDYPDAVQNEALIEQGALRVNTPPKKKLDAIARLHKDIHAGESEVIALAKDMNAIAIIDDQVARAVAKIQGVRVEGTYGVILRAAARGYLSREEAEASLEALLRSGWRCNAKLYVELLSSLRKLVPAVKPHHQHS